MPGLPGFAQAEITPAMEPVPLSADPAIERAAKSQRDMMASDRPPFFVQWKPQMSGLARPPRIDASTVLPVYPEDAIRKAEAGVTSLETCVTVEGRMVDVKLAQSSGSVTLDSATLAWAQTVRFAPAEFNGEPMAVCG